MKRNHRTTPGMALLAAIALLIFPGCGSINSMPEKSPFSSSTASAIAQSSYDTVREEAGEISADSASPQAPIPQAEYPRKIIRDAVLRLETKAFPEAVDQITAMTEEFQGYIQESYVSGASLTDLNRRQSRSARFVLRIDANQLDAFLTRLGETFNIVSQNITAEDVSDHYYDTKSRLTSMRIREERLLEMLQQAGELKDLLEIEKELAEVRYEIESLETTLKRLDSQVSLSTVTLDLDEVVEYTDSPSVPTSFVQQMGNAVQESWENFVSFCQKAVLTLIYAAPLLLLIALLLGIILFVCWQLNRRKRKQTNSVGPYRQPGGSSQAKPNPPTGSNENGNDP